MSVALLVLGILVTALGAVALGFGVPINSLPLGQTLIMAGATGLVGGVVLIGLAAAVARLTVIADALKVKPAPRAGRPAEATPRAEAPEPRPVEPRVAAPRQVEPRTAETTPSVDVSATAIERLRSSMARPERVVEANEEVPLSPNGSGHQSAEPPPAKHNDAVARSNGSGGNSETGKEPHLDFLFRAKPTRPAQPTQQPEAFDSMWPKRAPRGGATGEQPKAEEAPRPAPLPPEDKRSPAPEQQRSVAILKSGVVDGMAYTLYADGSIEAQLPQGTVRFGSIAELRAHIENNS